MSIGFGSFWLERKCNKNSGNARGTTSVNIVLGVLADGFDLEFVWRALVLGALGWSGNALKTVVMRVGPLQGT